ncbi:uncharacterized protein LOC130671488 [Microplitis mediator]|uniref:uncharacterized protein LOC130671488 n=1 Tax=Microplitis mediator TaxID=375433 RepID=UPI00255381B8|nr:uncharacterized protein LOC130671488 [Microplitis mediator]
MTNIVLLIFIKMLNIFLASTIPMNGINDSITKCAELKHKCNPYLQDPCCNPNRICVNKIRDQLYISDYICLKKGILNSPCKKSFDCEAIIGAKCSENGRCVCRKQSVAYNETICLRNSMDDRLVDELMDYYYDFTEIFYLKRNSSKSECQIISSEINLMQILNIFVQQI